MTNRTASLIALVIFLAVTIPLIVWSIKDDMRIAAEQRQLLERQEILYETP